MKLRKWRGCHTFGCTEKKLGANERHIIFGKKLTVSHIHFVRYYTRGYPKKSNLSKICTWRTLPTFCKIYTFQTY